MTLLYILTLEKLKPRKKWKSETTIEEMDFVNDTIETKSRKVKKNSRFPFYDINYPIVVNNSLWVNVY